MSLPSPHVLTGVQEAAVELPTGRWPDQLSFNKHLSTYLYSVASSVNITALDHIHVINYDLDGASPYTMTLNLPVMTNLPSASRLYFFYVSRCHNQDTLTFSPVALSGDTINGIAGNFSFALTGSKALFVCVGISNNYIIHPFNNSLSSGGNTSIPMVHFDMLEAPLLPVQNPRLPDSPVLSLWAVPPPNAYTGYQNLITGMEGFIVPNVPMPGAGGQQGFQCTESGIYAINPIASLIQSVAVTSTVGVYYFEMVHISSLGAYVEGIKIPCHVPLVGTGSPSYAFEGLANTTFYYPLVAGDFYYFGFIWDANGGTPTSAYITISVDFQYWCPLPVSFMLAMAPPVPQEINLVKLDGETANSTLIAPKARSTSIYEASDAPKVADNEIVMGSKQDKLSERKALHKKLFEANKAQQAAQTAARQAALTNGGNSLSIFSSSAGGIGGPSISLSDVEKIVQQVLRSQQAASSSVSHQESSLPSGIFSSSSSPSSVSAGKKRARSSSNAEDVEMSRPSKK